MPIAGSWGAELDSLCLLSRGIRVRPGFWRCFSLRAGSAEGRVVILRDRTSSSGQCATAQCDFSRRNVLFSVGVLAGATNLRSCLAGGGLVADSLGFPGRRFGHGEKTPLPRKGCLPTIGRIPRLIEVKSQVAELSRCNQEEAVAA